VWRRNGRELFYLGPDFRVRVVRIADASNGARDVGVPHALNLPAFFQAHWGTQYDVSPDGQRFFFMRGTTRCRRNRSSSRSAGQRS
jgi:hypothetical protein